MRKDTALKRFFSDDRRFADVINAFGCNGEQRVRPENLTDGDTKEGIWGEIGLEQIAAKEKTFTNLDRDLIRKTAFGTNFAIVGIENQDVEDYEIPFRMMSYDVSRYEKQIRTIRAQVRDKENKQKLTSGEYLYGFRKTDCLQPVVTFVLYYGEAPYDGALDLHGMLAFSDIPEEIQHMVQNYKVNFIDVRRLTSLEHLHTDVKAVFEFIRDSSDEEKWKQHLMEYQELDVTAVEVIAEYTNTKQLKQLIETLQEGGTVDMCKAWDDHYESGKREGKIEGKIEGEARLASLLQRLCADGNMEAVQCVIADAAVRNQYYAQYSL